MKLPNDDVERDSLGGLPASLAFFFLRKIMATTTAMMRTIAPAMAPPAMAAIGGPLFVPLASVEASAVPVVLAVSVELVALVAVLVVVLKAVLEVVLVVVLVVLACPGLVVSKGAAF
jgi:hypothetical protein